MPSGALDPTFNGGSPIALPSGTGPSGLAFGVVANPDGTLVVDLSGALVRYTVTGAPDPSFGSGGVAASGPGDLSQLLPATGGGVLAIHQSDAAPGHQLVERITAAGAIDPTLDGPTGASFEIPFGGGSASLLGSATRLAVPRLAQNTFNNGYWLPRPDGSYLVVGGVTASEPTGEGVGRSIFDFAAAALTPTLAPDPTFGGRATPLRAGVRVALQRASTARTRHGIRVTLNVSAPGLANVVVKARGRVIAHSVLAVFAPGARTLPVELTSYGSPWLRRHQPVSVKVTVQARDL